MPIYEYHCHQCQHEFEELVDFSEAAPDCPVCSGNEVIRLLSTPSFSLRGEGWYSDHYGLKKGAEEDSSISNESTDSSGSTSTSVEPSTTSDEE